MVQRLSQELRSEKARNVISPIPPILIRYGTLSIVLVCMLLVLLAAFLPARSSFTGYGYIDDISVVSTDSIYAVAYIEQPLLKKENLLEDSSVELFRMGEKVTGKIMDYKVIANNKGVEEYQIKLLFHDRIIEDFMDRGVAFTILLPETSILEKVVYAI